VRQSAFDRRQELLADSLTEGQVVALLQVAKVQADISALIGLMENNCLLFPLWQFDASEPNGVILGLIDVLGALNVSPLAKASWMTLPNPYLERRTPLQALKDGDTPRVLDQALAVGVI
jgi:hypothetical protein